jgi:hypothetical protein
LENIKANEKNDDECGAVIENSGWKPYIVDLLGKSYHEYNINLCLELLEHPAF